MPEPLSLGDSSLQVAHSTPENTPSHTANTDYGDFWSPSVRDTCHVHFLPLSTPGNDTHSGPAVSGSCLNRFVSFRNLGLSVSYCQVESTQL